MEERQRGHQPVLGGQLHPPREALAGHRVGAVGLGHELRAPGGAGGRDQHRRVVGLGRRGRRLAPPRASVGGSSTASLGSTWSTRPSSSASLLCGLTATQIAPRYAHASQVNRSPGRWAPPASTRSPRPTPRSASAAAAPADPLVAPARRCRSRPRSAATRGRDVRRPRPRTARGSSRPRPVVCPRSSTCARTPSPAPPRRCAGRWPRPRSATTSSARIRASTACRSGSRRCWARRRRCSSRPGRWPTSCRCELYCSPGDDVVVGAESHAVWHETGAAAANAGVQFTEAGTDGPFTAEQLRAVMKPRGHMLYPPTTLVEVEDTHNRMGGLVWDRGGAGGGRGGGARARRRDLPRRRAAAQRGRRPRR